MIKICNRVIEYSFYGLFLIVPWALWKDTSELFELNKMWLVWALAIIIGMAWGTKMVAQKRFEIQRTPLDIPIGLFLISQIISTIFSLDFHVSLWGYYSRFNGGLLSTISYIFLYYAFLSNFQQENLVSIVKRILAISLISGTAVALWGLPSHYGYDPTCYLFRGTLDVSCWTADFQPRARIFSTLGQPVWLAAYLAILIPIAIAFGFQKTQDQVRLGQDIQDVRNSETPKLRNSKTLVIRVFRVFWNKQITYLLLISLFYADLLFTQARSGVLAVWFSLIFFFVVYFWINGTKAMFSFSIKKLKSPRPTSPADSSTLPVVARRGELAGGRAISILIFSFLFLTFIIGSPISQLNAFSLDRIGAYLQKNATPELKPIETQKDKEPIQQLSVAGGTESANIRINVWTGAINAWRANPIFGTGVETFAFAYYKYKPVTQNLTSEWNFLYNKAHNEYLNYLATTGIVGLGTYLSMIFVFLWLCIKYFISSIKQEMHNTNYLILNTALVASYISILITNFFGFSVVMISVYLFMIPAFVFVLTGMINYKKNDSAISNHEMSVYQYTPIFFICLVGLYMLWTLFNFWRADIAYALGYNLDRAGEYQQAYENLQKAVKLRGSEPVFQDELSVNSAILAASLLAQKGKDTPEQTVAVASSLAQEAIAKSNEIISQHQNNAVFWKTRVRLFYTLSQVDSRYLPRALDGIEKASLLAPNDANIWYNLGVLYGQNNNIPKGISALEKTILLKPNYRDARYALGLFYYTASLDKEGKTVIDSVLQKKAIAQMQYILDHINPQDAGALESIKNWK